MKRLLTVLSLSFIYALWLGVHSVFAQSPSMKFVLANPGAPIKVGDTFSVKILIDTTGIDTINGDALFTFEPAKVSINTAVTGDFFTYFSSSPLGGYTDKYLVSSWEESVAHAKKTTTSDTLFATLTLSAVSEGTTTLSFDCTTGSESDTNINRTDSRDIITCPLQPLSFTIGAGGGGSTVPTTVPGGVNTTPTNTPVPTATRTPTPTSRPTSPPVVTQLPQSGGTTNEIPRAGIFGPTLLFAGLGALLTMAGVLIIL